MARSVTYSVVPRRNPSEKGTPPKFYAQAQARGDVSLREMSERIQATCTVHKSDVYAVLVALEDVISEAIQNGEIVRLGDGTALLDTFGHFADIDIASGLCLGIKFRGCTLF